MKVVGPSEGHVAALIRALCLAFCLHCGTALLAFASEPVSSDDDPSLSLPAVDGVNGKFAVKKSKSDDHDIIGATGSLAVPLGHRFGFQLDAGISRSDGSLLDDVPIYSGASHLFWRDPERALIGLYAHAVHVDEFSGLTFYAGGLETEMYWGQFSFENIVGFAAGDHVDTEFYASSTLAYYPTNNLRFDIGYDYLHGTHTFQVGSEWALGSSDGISPSLFAEASLSDGNSAAARLGMRIYLGQRDKSLIRRHREDDPHGLGTKERVYIVIITGGSHPKLLENIALYRQLHGLSSGTTD